MLGRNLRDVTAHMASLRIATHQPEYTSGTGSQLTLSNFIKRFRNLSTSSRSTARYRLAVGRNYEVHEHTVRRRHNLVQDLSAR